MACNITFDELNEVQNQLNNIDPYQTDAEKEEIHNRINNSIESLSNSLFSGISKIIEEQYDKERLKGHEVGSIIAQAATSVSAQIADFAKEMLKYDPLSNPNYKEDILLKRMEILLAKAKVDESCENANLVKEKVNLVKEQTEGYKVQKRVTAINPIVSMWQTYQSQSKTITAPNYITNATEMNNIIKDLAEYEKLDKLEGN
jgi:hypothetical protein